MSLLWTLILAIVQGFTEFLPVSSSAHLTILGAIAGLSEEDAVVFFVILHMGTLASILVYFRKDLWWLGYGLVKRDRPSWKFALLVLTTTVPTGVIGFGLKGVVEKALASPATAGALLFVTAAFLFATRYFPAGKKEDVEITWLDAVLVGIAQGLAVFPGISRSGATITASLVRGMKRETAFRYSFLASLPAVLGAFILEARHALSADNPHLFDDAVGMAVAFAVGLGALWLLRRTVAGGRFYLFSIWCVIAGIAGLVVALVLR